jgi:hypothetical protein
MLEHVTVRGVKYFVISSFGLHFFALAVSVLVKLAETFEIYKLLQI